MVEKICGKGEFWAWNETVNVWWTVRVVSRWEVPKYVLCLNNAKLVGLEWVWGLLQPGFVRWAPPPASQNHFNHWLPNSIVISPHTQQYVTAITRAAYKQQFDNVQSTKSMNVLSLIKCWFLTSTAVGPTVQPGVIIHYELDRTCPS